MSEIDSEAVEAVARGIARAAYLHVMQGLPQAADEYADESWKWFVEQAKGAITAMPTRAPAAAERIAVLEAALRDSAADLEAHIRRDFRGRTFPAAQDEFDEAMEPVTRANAALAGETTDG